MAIHKVGTFDGVTLKGWVIDQSDGQEITTDQLVTIDSVMHDAPGEVREPPSEIFVDTKSGSYLPVTTVPHEGTPPELRDETTPKPTVHPKDQASLTDEVVANVAEPEEVRPTTVAARRARTRW